MVFIGGLGPACRRARAHCARAVQTPKVRENLRIDGAASHVSPPRRGETTLDCEQLTGRLSQARNASQLTPRSPDYKIARLIRHSGTARRAGPAIDNRS